MIHDSRKYAPNSLVRVEETHHLYTLEPFMWLQSRWKSDGEIYVTSSVTPFYNQLQLQLIKLYTLCLSLRSTQTDESS